MAELHKTRPNLVDDKGMNDIELGQARDLGLNDPRPPSFQDQSGQVSGCDPPRAHDDIIMKREAPALNHA